DYLKGITSLFNNDGDFIYKAVNTNTNQMISQHSEKITTNDDQSKYSFYTEASYDQNGLVSCNGDLSSDKLSYFNIANLLSSFAHYDGENTIYIDNWMFDTNAIKINVPKNLQITYIIPETPASHGYASQYVNSWENYNYFSAIALLSCSAILVLFILFYPIKIVEDVNPFLSVKRWKAEINLAVLTLMITFGVMGCMIVTGYTLNNSLLELLKRYDIMYVDYIVIVINFVIWILTLLVISLGIFQLKYIFARGFWRYLKEDTLIGSGVRSIKNKLNQIADIDLSKSLNQTIMKYILINTAIIMIMITFWGFGYFLAIIYAFLVFFWVKDKVLKVQDDYDKLLTATKELSKGNFDVEIDGDLGIFNALNDEFKNIRIGFETAVKEETKSQNMKNELVSNVSHDLKTPLTCIKNYIVLLQDDNLPIETRHEYLDNLNQYSNRLTNLIEDLFEVSKVNSGNIKLNLMELNIVALIEQAHAECSEILDAHQLTVITNYPHNDIILKLDGDKTYRIFENLFTNISKYALFNSRVYVDLTEETEDITIIFKNISQEQMNFSPQEITERFVRGDKSRHESGSGLGLAIAKSFVEAQGGTFNIAIDGDLFKAIITFKKIAK
ncbi:MAG: HAMP domain-containing sensor histidine kinase, partial [Thomasclavelia ramosa]|nr:HAMP domain-containing sensor histidine kinase [Thomasclavelia ramosa]